MNITEVAAATGLSLDTIRYDERAGMLPPVPRDGRGWRTYPGGLVEWLRILARLRATGMPMAEMQRFATLVHGPDTAATRAARLAILHAHAARLDARQAEISAARAYLDQKIAAYGKDEP
jgi:DNA-binding transcriptional MerR regulator